MPLLAIVADITTLDADAIVNAANERLAMGAASVVRSSAPPASAN